MGLDLRLHSIDVVTLRAPLALRLRDVGDTSLVSDDLVVTATDLSPAARRVALRATAGGTWTATLLPGMTTTQALDPSAWSALSRPFEIRVQDRRGRYLPLRFTTSLPSADPIAWPDFASLPLAVRQALPPPGSDVGRPPPFVPLFPSIAAAIPGSRAEVRAHLAIAEAGVPAGNASYAVMAVSVGGQLRGVGIADGEGAVVVSFPYPLLPTPSPAERAAGTTRFEWPVSIAVFCGRLAVRADGQPPPLNDILAQLNRTASQVLERLDGLASFPEQILRVGQPLVLRSARAAPHKPSSLFLLPA